MMHKHSHTIQKAGVFFTVLCAIHCMAMPFLITALPLLGGFINETTEKIIVVISLILATIILLKDYKQHHKSTPIIIFIVGGLTQLSTIFLIKNNFETMTMIFGGVLIIIAYYINWKWHQKVFHEH